MKLGELSDRLDAQLDTEAFADVDGSANGLQVGDSERDVNHVAFAVDAALATIEEANDVGADVLVTHHGLWWEGTERLTGRTFDRVSALVCNEIGLYVSHLPLDAHPEFGNAAGLAHTIGLEDFSPFGEYHGLTVGRCGRYDEPRPFDELMALIEESVEREPVAFSFGVDEVNSVGIVTGSGVDWVGEALEAELDVLLTGEGKQYIYHVAREEEINVILAGHYATETFGVRALQDLVDEWGLDTTFIDHPTIL